MSKTKTATEATHEQDSSTTSVPVATHADRVGGHKIRRTFLALLSIAASAAASFFAARMAKKLRSHAEAV